MGCNVSASIANPILETVGNPIDIEISQVSVITTVQQQHQMFTTTSDVKISTSDDELLNEIVNKAQKSKPLLFCGPSLEMQEMLDVSRNQTDFMAVANGKPFELKLNYDCVYGPSDDSSQLETIMIVHSLSSNLHTNLSPFIHKPIVDVKSCGLDHLMSIIIEHIHQGWKPVTILPVSNDLSTTQLGTGILDKSSSHTTSSSTVIKIIFQKSSNQNFSDIQIIPFQMINTFTHNGTVIEPFDMTGVLNEHGQEGWELVSVFPLLDAEQQNKVQLTAKGLRGSTHTTYLAIMIRPTTNNSSTSSRQPIFYTRVTEHIDMSKMYIIKEKKESIIMSTVRTAAQAGWKLNSIIYLPGQIEYNKVLIPIQLYLSAHTITGLNKY